MDVPVALSIGAAYLWSAWATLVAGGPVYFDSAVMFTFLLLLGRYIEMSLRHRCGLQQHALARLLPDSVLRLRGAQSERVTPDELLVGDRLRVLPGERIAADGVVEQGRGEVDESLITGESVPQVRGVGGQLTAGTLNLSAPLEYRVERVGRTQRWRLCRACCRKPRPTARVLPIRPIAWQPGLSARCCCLPSASACIG